MVGFHFDCVPRQCDRGLFTMSGTKASEHIGRLPGGRRLIAVVEETALTGAQALVGTDVEVLVSVGEGRKDDVTGRVSGRARDGRLVHVTVGDVDVRPGDVVRTAVTYAAPHHLVADGGIVEHRPWRGRTIARHPQPAGRSLLPLTGIR